MHTNFCFQLCFVVVGLLCLTCDGSIHTGKGKIESFNGNRFTEAKSISQDGIVKTIFTSNRNRMRPAPPTHDTPASSCSCRKWSQCQCHQVVKKQMRLGIILSLSLIKASNEPQNHTKHSKILHEKKKYSIKFDSSSPVVMSSSFIYTAYAN